MTPLEKLWRDLADRSTWPAPPPKEPSVFRPISDADLLKLIPTMAQLAAMATSPDDLERDVPPGDTDDDRDEDADGPCRVVAGR